MWADMLALLPGAIPHLPEGIAAYDWYYYPFGRNPRMELYNFAEYDLAPALRARGIEYWGCPMNGSFRFEPLPVFGERIANIRSWWRRCHETGAAGMLVTSWEANRMAVEMTTVVDAAAASLWLDPGVDDAPGMLERGFRRVYGAAHSRERSRWALACDERAYAGYARWELNERWDTAPSRTGLSRFESERAFFGRLRARSALLPAPFRASVAFRGYLAERDVYVRSTAAAVLSLRRRLARGGPGDPGLLAGIATVRSNAASFRGVVRSGLAAARALWRLTRDPRRTGPNEAMAVADGKRLRALERWLEACARDSARLKGASGVCGAWQLMIDVVLTEPALQRIVVEIQDSPGFWRELHARTLVEFRAAAARPRTRLRRELSLPVPGPGSVLRIGIRGVGRVGIANPILTDGVQVQEPGKFPTRGAVTIGSAPALSGFPDLDWTRNADSLALDGWKAKRRPR